MRAIRICLAVYLSLAVSAGAAAGTNGLDPRFGTGGVLLLGGTPVNGQQIGHTFGMAVQSDGKILLAGHTSGMTPGPNPQSTILAAVARLEANGAWDTTFGSQGLYAFPANAVAPNGSDANQVALMSDGSIVATGGILRSFSGGIGNDHTCTLMFKLSSSGVLDTSFGGSNNGARCYDFAPEGSGSTFNFHFTGIQVGVGDVIYLTTPQTNLPQGAVARFTSAGVIDGSYGTNGIATTIDNAVFLPLVLQQDQRLIATGGFMTARFTTAGTLDPTFGTGGQFISDFGPYGPAYANSIRLDELGRVVTGLYSFSGSPYSGYLFTRLTAAGTPDNTFNGALQQPGMAGFASAPLSTASPYMIAAQPLPGGGIFAIGQVDFSGPMGFMRLKADSSFDSAYGDSAHPGWALITTGSGGPGAFNVPYSVAQDPMGRLMIAGSFNGTDISGPCTGLVRVIPDQLFADGVEAAPATPTCPP
jgi:uncharacterized delta-60 repeat protein